jgi:hypothetical protein
MYSTYCLIILKHKPSQQETEKKKMDGPAGEMSTTLEMQTPEVCNYIILFSKLIQKDAKVAKQDQEYGKVLWYLLAVLE